MDKTKYIKVEVFFGEDKKMNKGVEFKDKLTQSLGAIMYEFCCRLYWACSTYDSNSDALLFMSRGGLRLQYLFEKFLKVNNLEFDIACYPFWISRFAAVKLSFNTNPEWAIATFIREFSHTNCNALARAVLPVELFKDKEELLKTIPKSLGESPVTRESFYELYSDSTPFGRALKKHLDEQSEWGNGYLKDNFGTYKRLHTVDTGWFGSTLGTLQAGCRDWHWDALYFGRWNYRDEEPWYFNDIVGLMIDAKGLKGKRPMDILLEYHHLIEAILEPDMPSVEYFTNDGGNNASKMNWEAAIASMDNELWAGVLKYFDSKPSIELSTIVSNSTKGLKLLKRAIRYPSKAEALCMQVPARSADFGKNERTAIFAKCEYKSSLKTYLWDVGRSLWPAGKIAVSGKRAILLQQALWHFAKKVLKYRGAV